MPAEHVTVQSGGLRREHIVAAAMVTAVTVVLGFASGFGVRDAAAGPPANPSGPVATQPGGQPKAPPANVARPGGKAVGLRPGSQVVSGAAAQAGPGAAAQAGSGAGSPAGPGFDLGGLPVFPPESTGGPAAPPAGSVPPAAECPPGILQSLLALLSQVLNGATPDQAMSTAGILVLPPAESGPGEPGATRSGTGPITPNGVVDLPVLFPVGDRTVLVTGLIPLLDTVSRWEVAHRQPSQHAGPPADALAPAVPLAPAAGAPAGPAAGGQPPGDQLADLAALLAPVGLYADPGTGIVDPLLAPVLGSLGCGGIVPAAAPGAVR